MFLFGSYRAGSLSITLQTCTWDTLGSNLGQSTAYLHGGPSKCSSVPVDQFRDLLSIQARTISFQNLSNSPNILPLGAILSSYWKRHESTHREVTLLSRYFKLLQFDRPHVARWTEQFLYWTYVLALHVAKEPSNANTGTVSPRDVCFLSSSLMQELVLSAFNCVFLFPLYTVVLHVSPLYTVALHVSPLYTVVIHVSPLYAVVLHVSPLCTVLRISKTEEENPQKKKQI
jgi:hypothetical protein